MEPEDLLNYENDPTITSKIGDEKFIIQIRLKNIVSGKYPFYLTFKREIF